MTDWKTVHDSRPDQPAEVDTKSSLSTVYIRRNIRQETVQDATGGSVQQWVYEQMTYTTDEYATLNGPQTQALMQALTEQIATSVMAGLTDTTSLQESIMQGINQQTADIVTAMTMMGG